LNDYFGDGIGIESHRRRCDTRTNHADPFCVTASMESSDLVGFGPSSLIVDPDSDFWVSDFFPFFFFLFSLFSGPRLLACFALPFDFSSVNETTTATLRFFFS
jgi:hypothetical protein